MNNRRSFYVLVCALVLAAGGQAWAHPGGGNSPSPALPPIIPEGYLSPQDVHAKYSGPALAIVLSMIEHQPYAGMPPENFPDGERHHFESQMQGLVSIGGGPLQPIFMTGPVDTVAYGKGPTDVTGTFDTEMLSMNLVGGGGILIRESPTKQSLGKTSITDIGGGLYHIDSFFDVFTELSMDGGQTWIPKSGLRGTRVVLGGVPEPTSIVLMGLALVGMTGLLQRRK